MAKTRIKFDTTSMLSILVGSLYDTPLVFLRENLQNAYDAVLLRKHYDKAYKDPIISLNVIGNTITIKDNGIGMDDTELDENYWTAGKSGKNNDDAREAGVVGTFGIGALANFGVCQKLEVRTRRYDKVESFISIAIKENYEDIDVSKSQENLPIGTSIIATLQNGQRLSSDDALAYIKRYVEFLSIPVYFNNVLVSGNSYVPHIEPNNILKYDYQYEGIPIKYNYCIFVNRRMPVNSTIYIWNIEYSNNKWDGNILLDNTKNDLFGLRNGFGLSSIPLTSVFQFGGLVNLSMLKPTAGREAIRKEYLNLLQRILSCIEREYADYVSKQDYADSYRDYLNYVNSHFSNDLVSKIKIQLANAEQQFIELSSLLRDKDKVRYYKGNDNSILSKFAHGEEQIVIVSKEYPRHQIQLSFLQNNGIKEIEDKVVVEELYDYHKLDLSYYSIGNSIHFILEKDYILQNNKVEFAKISHNVKYLIEKDENDYICVYLAKDNTEINALKDIYENSYSVFDSVMKDFIRNYLYQQLIPYIPSSKKEGIAAICNILKRKQEEFSIDKDDTVALDKAFLLYKDRKITAEEFSAKIRATQKSSTQEVRSDQIKHVEEIIKTPTTQLIQQRQQATTDIVNYGPLPPIMHDDISTKAKLLYTDQESEMLHGYKKFLTLTDQMYKENYYFFIHPHTTRVIWSMHRIIYVLSLINCSYTIYYEMELKKQLASELTGGEQLQTTTIITKDKIFIPIPQKLNDYFDIKTGSLKFKIRFDGVDGSSDL